MADIVKKKFLAEDDETMVVLSGKEYYEKPENGIPKSDLSTAVQGQLVPTRGSVDKNSYLYNNVNNTLIWKSIAELPAVSAADNNKVLTVTNGAWSAQPTSGGGDAPTVLHYDTNLNNFIEIEYEGMSASDIYQAMCFDGQQFLVKISDGVEYNEYTYLKSLGGYWLYWVGNSFDGTSSEYFSDIKYNVYLLNCDDEGPHSIIKKTATLSLS